MVLTRSGAKSGGVTTTTAKTKKPPAKPTTKTTPQKAKKDAFAGLGEKVGTGRKRPGPKPKPKGVTTSDKPLPPSKPLNAPKPDYNSKNAKPTPKKAVTKVRGPETAEEEKPIKNIYGEDQMGSNTNQRLEQCIIFLSDEGPENHPQFKDKLRKIEHEIGSVWPARRRREGKAFSYDKKLHTKVMNMVSVHRVRMEAGAREWFEQTMFPQFPVDNSDTEAVYPLPPVKARPAAKKTKQDKLAYEALAREQDREEMAAFAKDPWPEKMPRAEVWHRKMPARFPFGDTPAMEAEMSRQISKDLGEDKVSAGTWLMSLFSATYDFIRGAPYPQSTWALPNVSKGDVDTLTATLAALDAKEKKAADAATTKEKASDASIAKDKATKEAAAKEKAEKGSAAAKETPGTATEQSKKRKDPFPTLGETFGTGKRPRPTGIGVGPDGEARFEWD